MRGLCEGKMMLYSNSMTLSVESELSLISKQKTVVISKHLDKRLKQRVGGFNPFNEVETILNKGTVAYAGKDRIKVRNGKYCMICKIERDKIIAITVLFDYDTKNCALNEFDGK